MEPSTENYVTDFSASGNSLNISLNISLDNSTSSLTDDVRDESLARMEIGTLALIFVLIITGNLSVLVALAAGRLKMRRMYYFLLHLSIADLITGFFTVLPQLAWDITYRFYGGNVMCKTIKYLQLLGPYLSSYVLVMTAIDRYQAICFPLANCTWTARRSKLMIAFAWIVSALCCTPQLFIFSYQQVSPEVYDCWGTYPQPWGERAYVTWYAVTVFIIPLIILTFTYVCICREIWINAKRTQKSNRAATMQAKYCQSNGSSRVSTPNKRLSEPSDSMEMSDATTKRQRPRNQRLIVEVGTNYRFRGNNKNVRCFVEEVSTSSEDTTSRHSVTSKFNVNIVPRSHCSGKLSRAKIKTIKITIVVIFCYVFCSLPFIAVQLWAYWWPGAQETVLWSGPFIAISMLLSSLNSCVNPWIYLFFNRNLFNTLQKICCHPFARFRSHKAGANLHDFNSSMHSETGLTGQTGGQDSGRERLGSRPKNADFLSPHVCHRLSFDASMYDRPADETVQKKAGDQNSNQTVHAQVTVEPPPAAPVPTPDVLAVPEATQQLELKEFLCPENYSAHRSP